MNIYILALEPVESRYTYYWVNYLPEIITSHIQSKGIIGQVFNILGDQISTKASPGAFLNFSETNIWKNTQMNKVAQLFQEGKVQPGDKFLFADAWHPGILQLKYMSDLLDIPIEIHSLWHAGSYDPWDFLGRKIKDKTWSLAAEESFFYASDVNYFATQYHWNLFLSNFEYIGVDSNLYISSSKAVIAGYPFGYLNDVTHSDDKDDLILFPHRIAPEKQHEIFLDLAKHLPQYKFITCQSSDLTKEEYYALLAKSKMVFSANLQETLGIGCYEGLLSKAYPLVPDRLSYSEIYTDEFKYPSEWTENWDSYVQHRDKLISRIVNLMDNYSSICYSYHNIFKASEFFNPTKLLNVLCA